MIIKENDGGSTSVEIRIPSGSEEAAQESPSSTLSPIEFSKNIISGLFGGDKKNEFCSYLIYNQGLDNRNEIFNNYFDGINLDFDGIQDPFRFSSGKYWIDTSSTLRFLKKDNDINNNLKVPFQITSGDRKIIRSENKLSEEASYKLFPDKREFSNSRGFQKDLWEIFVNGGEYNGRSYDFMLKEGVVYEDHAFEVFTPYHNNTDKLARKYTIDSEYNFYHRHYEETIKQSSVDEASLPNIYSILSQKNGRGTTENRDFNTIFGNIDDSLIQDGVKFRDDVQYFDAWSKAIMDIDNETRTRLANRYRNIFIGNTNTTSKEANEFFNTFSAGISITLPSDNLSEYSFLLNKLDLEEEFLKYISDFEFDVDSTENENHIAYKQDEVDNKKVTTSESISIKSSNVNSWIDEMFFEEEFLTYETTTMFGMEIKVPRRTTNVSEEALREMERNDDMVFIDATTDKSDLELSLKNLVFKEKLADISKNYFRSFNDILNGKKAHAEIVGYKINKFSVDSNNQINDEPIQSYFLLNQPNEDKNNFLDTQVKYGKQYAYGVEAYCVVYGNSYQYSSQNDEGFQAGLGNTIDFDVKNSPSTKLVSIPFIEPTNVKVVDNPPLSPNVEFIPYRDVDDVISISLNTQVGVENDFPIIIDPDDFESEEEKIKFSTDDYVAAFEVYRLNNKPLSYKDFSNNKVATVSTKFPENSNGNASLVSFKTKLEFNKKYYYMFRSVDIHNHVSNPSLVYEVEKIKDSGASYLLVNVVEFKKDSGAKTKKARKYIRIKATDTQKVINTQKSGISNEISEPVRDVILGMENESAWNKKFKIRLTSKNTGKKIDINFIMKYGMKGYKFGFTSGNNETKEVLVNADSFSEALSLLLIEQSDAII